MDRDDRTERHDDALADTDRTPQGLEQFPWSEATHAASSWESPPAPPEAGPQRSASVPRRGWVILGTGEGRQLATRWGRLVAVVIDLVIVAVVVAVASIADRSETSDVGWVVWLVVGLFAAGYEVTLIALRGQTLGKMALKIRVVHLDNGDLPGWLCAIRRVSLPVALSAVEFAMPDPYGFVGPLLGLLCYASLTWHPLRRGWHDMFAGTVVVRT
ncbi:MAG: RDD family protein [bacterium]|nr:RDD family protein [bacterium]MXV89989.1 RDD family protein [Acidimicrobiia bacterium]MYC44310.1 RDD family protein [Acidimicrobiia bacterium]MYI20125.1 RDD family protein [Acidimicrobiia bacterium]